MPILGVAATIRVSVGVGLGIDCMVVSDCVLDGDDGTAEGVVVDMSSSETQMWSSETLRTLWTSLC